MLGRGLHTRIRLRTTMHIRCSRVVIVFCSRATIIPRNRVCLCSRGIVWNRTRIRTRVRTYTHIVIIRVGRPRVNSRMHILHALVPAQ